ncbi:MAG: TlpA disulfide reductase family protein [Acidobacteriota bacterium]
MRNLAMRVLTAASFVALTVSAFAMPPVPRNSPEFTVTEPSGKQVLLSSLRGKIVVMPFMFTTCPHCQRYAQMLTKLQQEFAGRGVVMLGTVFNDANAQMAAQFVREFQVGFPVGYASRDQVVSYLGLSVLDRWVVPQVAIIDKKGNVVAQSVATGTPELQDEAYLRNFLEKLVKESSTSSKSAPPVKTSAKTAGKSSAKTN